MDRTTLNEEMEGVSKSAPESIPYHQVTCLMVIAFHLERIADAMEEANK